MKTPSALKLSNAIRNSPSERSPDSWTSTLPPRREVITRLTVLSVAFDSGAVPGGVGVVRIATGGGTASFARRSRTTFDPLGAFIATARSLPSGDIEQATRRKRPPPTDGFDRRA